MPHGATSGGFSGAKRRGVDAGQSISEAAQEA